MYYFKSVGKEIIFLLSVRGAGRTDPPNTYSTVQVSFLE